MKARTVSLDEFCARVLPVLGAAEAENNLPIGLALRAASGQAAPESAVWVSVETGADSVVGDVVGAAIWMPPREVLVTRLPPEAAQAVAALLEGVGIPVPGVQGPDDAGLRVAECLAARQGRTVELLMKQRLFELTAVQAVAQPPGSMRRATLAEVPLVARWYVEFADEVRLIGPGSGEEWARRTVGVGAAFVWEDGEVCSLACTTRETPGSRSIGPVYTPPKARRRGYATALVAALSQLILDSGKSFVSLFTDTANPTSNHIYESIGYRPLCRFDAYALTGPGRPII
jgi:uncharacterized protein